MTRSFLGRFAGLSKFLTGFVVLALIAAALITVGNRSTKNYVTVNFKQTNSLYKGSDVKILGVPVGTVKSLTPKGNLVRVRIAYDKKYKLPADVKAAIVSPSLVGDRFVQLAPAYSGGAVLPNNASLGVERSVVPIELDQVFSSLDDLATALGPQGANKDGSLSRFLSTTAKGLDGQGEQLNTTIKNFSKLSQTLSNNKDDLFGSLDEVGQFIAMLKKNDSSVRAFNDSTAKVSTVLEGERGDLAGTLKALSLALNDVRSLVKDNRSSLRGNVKNLTILTNVLAKDANIKSLTESINAAPTALSNVAFTYNGSYGTLDTRANLLQIITGGLKDPSLALCTILGQAGAPDELCKQLGGLLGGLMGGAKLAAADPSSSGAASATPGGALGGLELTKLPRTAAGSLKSPRIEQVSHSVQDMLAVN